MGSYSVMGSDGRLYGPVDEQSLASWAQAGRVSANTQVNVAATGQTVPAMTLDFLQGIFRMPPPVPASQPVAPWSPYQLAQPGTPAAAANLFGDFPTAVAILLHFVTLGIFTSIWLNLMHGKMPKIRYDDPSAGKAIGFLFIPFFNLYWVFFTYTRLCTRINEQRAMAGLPPKAPGGLAIAMCILMIIPYIGLISWAILVPIFLGIVQSSVNELARMPRQFA